MNAEILNFIEDYQKGKQGIYPYRVAQEVAIKFAMPMHEAIEHVSYHVKTELYSMLGVQP